MNNIMQEIIGFCRHYPQILIFLSLAIGYYVGKLRFKGFSLGSTASILLVAILLGQMDVIITPLIKSVAFALFIFTIGYKVGPQFFGGLKKTGLKYVVLTVFVAIVGLITALLLGKLFTFDQGTTSGLLAGALTQSSVIGTADDAIRNLSISAADKNALTSNIAVAYAITYIFGVAGLIFFYKIVPKVFKINLKTDAHKLETKLLGSESSENNNFNIFPSLRTYRVENKDIGGKTVAGLKKLLPPHLIIEKIKRNNVLITPEPDTIIHINDIIAIIGKHNEIVSVGGKIGPEINDPILHNLQNEVVKICISNPSIEGKTLGTVIKNYGDHCYITRITHNNQQLPLKKETILFKGTILQVVGLKKSIQSLAHDIGYIERKKYTTDLILVSLGCFLGTLLGLITITIKSIPFTLGAGGGILLVGILFGWLHSKHPSTGNIPQAAQWLLTDLGLNLFIACVGLTAGPKAIGALKSHGPTLFIAGIILTLTPHILGLLFGRKILKLDYVLLFGALTGAGTATPSLNVVKDEADSLTPVLGFTVPYALGNFILTVWGTVIVNLM